MTAALVPLILLMPVFGIASAVCSACETALFSLTASDRLRQRKSNPGAAAATARLMTRPRRVLVGLLLLNTIANVGFAVVASLLGSQIAEGWGDWTFRGASLLFLIIFCEIMPKSFASVHSARLASLLSPTLEAVLEVLGPVLHIFDNLIVAPLSRLARPAGAGEATPLTALELSGLLRVGTQSGGIDAHEQRVLSQVLGLGEWRVRDVMAPRMDIRWLDEGAGEIEVIRAVQETGHTKFPVCKGSLDGGVIGLVNAKAYLQSVATPFPLGPGAPPKPSVGKFAQGVIYVPDRVRLDRLLEQFRAGKAHVALCVDEFGQITGLIEIEDVVQRLIAPEVDPVDALADAIAQINDTTWLVPGRLSVRHWEELFGVREWRHAAGQDVQGRHVTTLAGLVFSLLGKLPRVGDEVRISNLVLRVETMDGRMVGTIRVAIDLPTTHPHAREHVT